MTRFTWLLTPLLVALLAWLPGVNWGLPTRTTDTMLFGDRRPWTGPELLALLPREDATASRGADVDATPLEPTTQPVLLNRSDADRAVIVRRYRLQSRQPDEFINFKSIAEMARRGDLDPRLYQYGGLWLYPLAGTLKLASMLGIVELRGDMAFYLDHPEKFGRFYVVARLVSVGWGLLGVVAVCWIVRRLTDHRLLATLAGIGFAVLPIVVNAAHEAKPHLAGSSLMLLSIIPATRFVERGRWRDAILTGLTSGAAAAMVLTASLGLSVLPMMAVLRRDTMRRRVDALLLALACAAGLYGATNPFVLYNALARQELLSSNLGNSTAMYAVGFSGLARALQLLAMGGTAAVLVMAVVGLVALVLRPRPRDHGSGATGQLAAQCDDNPSARGHELPRGTQCTPLLLLAGPAVLGLAQFVLLAAGKPAEYVRFALLPLSAMLVVAMVGIHRLLPVDDWARRVATLFVGCIGVFGTVQTFAYLGWAGGDPPSPARGDASRPGSPIVHVFYEPAPWSCPPINLFNTEIRLVPRDQLWSNSDDAGTTWIGPTNLASQFGVNDARETFNWAANQWFVRSTTTPSLDSER